ncbi:MAG: YitT family protein [Firmicutes bacterium]|nr:YitT family protein [Bacillota bacterium]
MATSDSTGNSTGNSTGKTTTRSLIRKFLASRFVLSEYLMVFVGAAITALALDWLLVPNRIAAGGVSGIATVIYYLFKVRVGVTMLVINIPLFLASVRILGGEFGAKTLFAAVSLSLLVDFLQQFLRPLTADPLLAALYGGILSGVGMGITFKFGGSTAGTDLAALLLQRWLGTSVGQTLLFIDFVVITLAGIVFNAELALYALIALFVTSKVIDVVQEGVNYAKAAFIVSGASEEIAARVLTELGRGATLLHGKGMYTRTDRDMLFVIVSRAEIAQLKELVWEADPRAFVVIGDAHEVLGEGFKGGRT